GARRLSPPSRSAGARVQSHWLLLKRREHVLRGHERRAHDGRGRSRSATPAAGTGAASQTDRLLVIVLLAIAHGAAARSERRGQPAGERVLLSRRQPRLRAADA